MDVIISILTCKYVRNYIYIYIYIYNMILKSIRFVLLFKHTLCLNIYYFVKCNIYIYILYIYIYIYNINRAYRFHQSSLSGFHIADIPAMILAISIIARHASYHAYYHANYHAYYHAYYHANYHAYYHANYHAYYHANYHAYYHAYYHANYHAYYQ